MKDCSGATQLDKSKSGNKSSNQSTISTEFASSNGVSGMADTSSGDSGSANRIKEDRSNFTQIMLNRWNQANSKGIPQLDQKDVFEQGHFRLPKLNAQPCALDKMHQHHPEFTNSSYNRLRSLEDAFQINNYLENVPKT